MAESFKPTIAEPYTHVDATSGITRGQLLYAAARGDARAKATLKLNPRAAQEASPATHDGSITSGRSLYTDGSKRAEST